MANLPRLLGSGNLHPRENLFVNGAALAALNAEVQLAVDGCTSFSLDLRDTFSLTVAVEGTVDGLNWTAIPVRPLNQAAVVYVLSVAGATQGIWVGECFGFKTIRARVAAFTSGSVNCTLLASNAPLPVMGGAGQITATSVTSKGAAAAAVTLTLTAPGAGLRHYLTYLSINRFATALLTAAATPVTVTTTNLPGSLAFSFGAEAMPQGQIDRWCEDFAFPFATSAQNTATTIVCPATTGVIWQVTAGYFVAP